MCGGQFRRPAGGFGTWRALDARATKQVDPCRNSLFVYAQDQGDLGTALVIQDREDGEEIFDLTQGAEVLSRLQVALHFFTVGCRDGKTNVAHRDFPPQ